MLQLVTSLLLSGWLRPSLSEVVLTSYRSFCDPGDRAFVICSSTTGEPVYWSRNDREIHSNGQYEVYDLTYNVTLIFRRVEAEAVGDYWCSTANDRKRFSLRLTTEFIQFRGCNDSVLDNIGRTDLLSCTVTFLKEDGVVLWKKGDRVLGDDGDTTVTGEGLVIRELSLGDQGTYTVIATTVSSVTRSRKIRLRLRYGPVVGFREDFLWIGDSTEIGCRAWSIPSAKITLLVNGSARPIVNERITVMERTYATESTIALGRIANTKYNVTCMAHNGENETEISRIFSADAPNPPRLRHRGHLVTWEANNRKETNITDYEVIIESLEFPSRNITFGAGTAQMNLTDYVDKTGDYNVTLIARNAVGGSIPVKISVFVCVAGKEYGPSSGFIVSIVSPVVIVFMVFVTILAHFAKKPRGTWRVKPNVITVREI